MNSFIFTEIYNCGKIGNISIKSFIKYHPDLVLHIYGKKEDFEWIEKNDNLIFHYDEEFQNEIIESYKRGHEGTGKLWANLIKQRSEKYFIHFDSDVIFRKETISIFNENMGYDLVGAIRNYKNNPHNNENIKHLNDTVSTNIFMFNKEKIKDYGFDILYKMCQGIYNPHKHEVLDFFDPIMFDIIYNGGKVKFIDFDLLGGSNNMCSRDNKYKEINNYNTPFKIDFGENIIHFSAVGSGMNCFHNNVNIPTSYKNYAIDRYALFCKIYYNEDLGIDLTKYNDLINFLKNDK